MPDEIASLMRPAFRQCPRRFFRTTAYDTKTPTKYSTIIGAMKISMVVASGVGVMIAAATVMISMA